MGNYLLTLPPPYELIIGSIAISITFLHKFVSNFLMEILIFSFSSFPNCMGSEYNRRASIFKDEVMNDSLMINRSVRLSVCLSLCLSLLINVYINVDRCVRIIFLVQKCERVFTFDICSEV